MLHEIMFKTLFQSLIFEYAEAIKGFQTLTSLSFSADNRIFLFDGLLPGGTALLVIFELDLFDGFPNSLSVLFD